MSKFKLAFGIHNHQPVGNFQAVFEEAHTNAYQPFLELLKQAEHMRISIHQSGILWHWQQEAHPEYFQLVGELIDRGQVELMTGGFYEPILIAIPERDSRGQIAMLNNYLKKHFEQQPEGLWLTERIWEPHLPKLLAQSGVKYLPIDDTHFLYAGFELNQLTGPFITENEGYQLTLLPIQKRLRYLIPFGTVEEVINELKAQAERNPNGMAVYADDGEKFGVWPNTHEHCYDDGWLKEFMEKVEKNSDWLEIVPLGEIAKQKPVGRAYLPSASYAEMLHWALPPIAFLEYEKFEKWLKEQEAWDRYGRYVRGGHWRGFLAKYDEVNLMHKKMLAVSNRLAEFKKNNPEKSSEIDVARNRLYAGQCNCPYWHGVFGGLYLPHIRQAIYANLIEADSKIAQLEDDKKLAISSIDYDIDGYDEVVVSSEALSAVFKPNRGGNLIHLALNKHYFDPTDTLTRRKEGYHFKLDKAVTHAPESKTASIHDLILAKEEGLKELLREDWYLKRCLIDHFFTDDVDFERYRSGRFGEEGDFIVEPFDYNIDDNNQTLTMTRNGHLWRPDGVIPVRLEKRCTFEQGTEYVRIRYSLSCPEGHRVSVNFGVENNFNFQAGHAEDRFILIDGQRHENCYLDSEGAYNQVGGYSLLDQYRDVGIAVMADRLSDIWHLPIFTVSLSEGGFEKVYQGTTFINLFHLELSENPVKIHIHIHTGAINTLPERTVSIPVVNP
ncbi:MAG: hypothetical protein DRP47_01020 [Candidatus Zixiibacteriota bacterium]|nr:MAG: hypothetical protein DRP47_01020 [candidate division Zixibacteria bacterium]